MMANCSCDSEVCSHGRGHRCGQPAAAMMTIHVIHGCNRSDSSENGNRTGPVCQPCLNRIRAAAEQELTEMIPRGFRSMCLTCGAPIRTVSDLIRDVRPLT